VKILLRSRDSNRLQASFELAPFIDMVFTLLIFFAVTTTLMTQKKALDMDLPSAESTVEQSPGIVISIDQNNIIHLDDAVVTIDTLQARISAILANKPDSSFIFRADKTVPYDTVISTLDKTRLGGAAKLFLEAESPATHD
jgi:biopolymer transport protein ExbD